MLAEVASAAGFLSKLMRTRCTNPDQVDQFRECLEQVLTSHYDNHWFPEKPHKGSGYRCIRIVNSHMDPLVKSAGSRCGLSSSQLAESLPNEITMWVDPEEVSYRFGEEGSIGMLYQKEDTSSLSSEADTSSDSDACSVVSSAAPSPTQEIIQASSCRGEEMLLSSLYHTTVRNGNFNMFLPQMQFVAS